MRPGSPVRSIWFRPKETIANIAHDNPGYRLYLFPIVAGFVVLPTMALFSNDDDIRRGFVLASLLAFGPGVLRPVIELLQVFVGAWLIRMTGLWLGGRASITSIQTAIAWCHLPIAIVAILGLVLMLVSMFLLAPMDPWDEPLSWNQSAAIATVFWTMFAIQTALIGWSLVILINGLAAVQGYSIWRAALNAALAWGIVATIAALAALLFTDAAGLFLFFFAGFDDMVILNEP